MAETKSKVFQYSPIEDDVPFKAGSTKTLAPLQPAAGAGDPLRLRGGPAAVGSNAHGGDSLLTGGAGDGTGRLGRARVESTCLVVDETNPATIAPIGPTQIGLCAEDDGGDTEVYLDTPQGKIQVTKDGALNVNAVTSQPVVDASVHVSEYTSVAGGSGDPTQGTVGSFKSLDFPSGASREVRASAPVPFDFRDASGDSIDIILKYSVTAGVNPIVRIQTFGASENNSLGALNIDLNVSAATPGLIYESPIIRTIVNTDIDRLGNIAAIIKRLTFGGEFTGDFRLVSVVFVFKSLAVTPTTSESTDFFLSVPSDPPPVPGVMGSFKTTDYPAGVTRACAGYLNVPKRYQVGSDVILRLSYAMGAAVPGSTVDLEFEVSVNNVTAVGPLAVTLTPPNTANQINLSPLVVILTGLQRLDDLAVVIRRKNTGSHPGSFRLVSLHMVMVSTPAGSGATGGIDYVLTDTIAGVGPPDTDTESFLLTENEVYRAAIGLGTAQDVTFAFRGRLPSDKSEIAGIQVVHKATDITGNNGVYVTVRTAGGTVVYTSTKQVSLTRTVFTIPGAALSAQPLPDERFLVLVQAVVDNGDTVYVGSTVVISYD